MRERAGVLRGPMSEVIEYSGLVGGHLRKGEDMDDV